MARSNKPIVAVPRVGVGASSSSSGAGAGAAAAAATAPQLPPRRRPGARILAELRAAGDEARAARPPPLTGGGARPLLDAAEKERCALLMQFNGRLPAAPPAPAPAGRRGCRGGGDSDDDAAGAADDGGSWRGGSGARALQSRFATLAREVAEREEWLEEMRKDGLLQPEHAAAVRSEIAGRAAEMRRLDAAIARAEGVFL